MELVSSQKTNDAVEIIKENGFIDLTPYISNATHKIFKRNELLFRFTGWKTTNSQNKEKIVCVEKIHQNVIDKKILKMSCPGCGATLNNYNFFDDGKNMFWCNNCLYEILIIQK